MVRISLIVATYNRGEQLLRTLRSLVDQSLNKELWEAIIVDNNSSDDTQELFKKFIASTPQPSNIRMVFERRQGLSYARNCGIEQARGEYIAIIDDDEEANVEFLEQYLDFFDSHPNAMAAGGRIVPLYEFEPPKWLSYHTERPISATIDKGKNIKLFRSESNPIGGNMAFRSSVFERFGVFNPKLGRKGTNLMAGEEKDLFRRIRKGGGRIYWVPGPEILHIIPESRFSHNYFSSLTKMVGVSERTRTLSISKWAYIKRLGSEIVKWGGTLVLSLGYTLQLKPSKAQYLLIMRSNITRGLLKLV